jgi:hypothetical protein
MMCRSARRVAEAYGVTWEHDYKGPTPPVSAGRLNDKRFEGAAPAEARQRLTCSTETPRAVRLQGPARNDRSFAKSNATT